MIKFYDIIYKIKFLKHRNTKYKAPFLLLNSNDGRLHFDKYNQDKHDMWKKKKW